MMSILLILCTSALVGLVTLYVLACWVVLVEASVATFKQKPAR
jgi:hypothetical protein